MTQDCPQQEIRQAAGGQAAATATPARSAKATAPRLVLVQGEGIPEVTPLGGSSITLGRASSNDVVLRSERVSRTHAEIAFQKGAFFVTDRDSKNGVRVDGKKTNRAILSHGSTIAIGGCELRFEQCDPGITAGERLIALKRSDLLSGMGDSTLKPLASKLEARFYPAESLIARQGKRLSGIFFIETGRVRVVDLNDEGGERLVDILEPESLLGERSLLSDSLEKRSFIADTDLWLLHLPRQIFSAALAKEPRAEKAFRKSLLGKLRAAQSRTHAGLRRLDDLAGLLTSTEVEVVGNDRRVRGARETVERRSKEGKPVLILGEAGVGKRTLARHYHQAAFGNNEPYVEVSSTEMKRGGLSLFGVEGDPDATHMSGRMGYIEMVGRGTVCVTRAERLDAHQQEMLVTYLRKGWFQRMYGQERVEAETRIVLVAKGGEAEVKKRLIPELWDILKGAKVTLSPLSARPKDIPMLADHFLKRYAKTAGAPSTGLAREALDRLVSYNWPGNLTELANVIERAVLVTSEEVIIPGDLIFVSAPGKDVHRLNMLQNKRLLGLLNHPLTLRFFVAVNILMVFVVACLTIIGGLLPEGRALTTFETNPGMLLTWVIWFPLLPLSAVLLGRVWCGICPIAGVGNIFAKILRFNLRVPRLFKRLDFWLLILAFLFLDFFEDLWGVAEKPVATGLLLVVVVSAAVFVTVLFERQTFCRYLCPLGGMLGAYSTMSPLEIRGNKKVCQTQCGQHLCYKGSKRAAACPLSSYPASLTQGTECLMCFNCIKSCESRGVKLNLRPPLAEIWQKDRPALALSVFAVMLVGILGRHQVDTLAIFAPFERFPVWMSQAGLFVVALGSSLGAFFVASVFSSLLSRERLKENMASYGLAFIPLAFAAHLSHVVDESLGEGINDIFAMLLSTVRRVPALASYRTGQEVQLIHPSVIGFLEFCIVSIGVLSSFVALVMVARRLGKRSVKARVAPHLLLLLGFAAGYYYIFVVGALAAEEPESAVQVAQAAPLAALPGTGAGTIALDVTLSEPRIGSAAVLSLTDPAVMDWLAGSTGSLTIQGQVSTATAGALLEITIDSTRQSVCRLSKDGRFRGRLDPTALRSKSTLHLRLISAGGRDLSRSTTIPIRP